MIEDKNQVLCLKDENETKQCSERLVQDAIFLYYKEKHRKFEYNDILWIGASGSYCNIMLAGKKKILIVYTLYQIFDKLPKEQFVRIHRSYIVNIHAVTAFYHKVLYVGDEMLPISSPYLDAVMACFNSVGNRKMMAK